MSFDDFWNHAEISPAACDDSKRLAHWAWNAARPEPLTDDEIRECWVKCEHSAPMAFARELQKKLGIIG